MSGANRPIGSPGTVFALSYLKSVTPAFVCAAVRLIVGVCHAEVLTLTSSLQENSFSRMLCFITALNTHGARAALLTRAMR